MDKYELLFMQYILENYDINEKLIREKFDHTLRVKNLTTNLSEKLSLSEEEQVLAEKIALFHDLGRFHEVIRHQQFNNLRFDHGAYSNKILFNDGIIHSFDISDDDYLLIKKAIYYHNKKHIGNDLDGREQKFAKIIRDTDKIDIINVRTINYRMCFEKLPNPVVLSNFFHNEEIDLHDIKSQSDTIILYLGFINNLAYPESKEIFRETGYLQAFLNSINVSSQNEKLFEDLKGKVLDDERGKVYVRKKI